jgi:hypothetical protein
MPHPAIRCNRPPSSQARRRVEHSHLPQHPPPENRKPSNHNDHAVRRMAPAVAPDATLRTTARVFPVCRRSWKCRPGRPMPATASFHPVSMLRFPLRIGLPFSPVKTQASGLLPTYLARCSTIAGRIASGSAFVRRLARAWLLAVSSGFGDQVRVVSAWRVDEGMIVSLAA